MKKRMQAIFVAVAIFCMFVSVLAYTRPLTIEQRYPVLDSYDVILMPEQVLKSKILQLRLTIPILTK